MVDTPHPIRTAKLSSIGPDQYCGGGPRGNLGCRMFFFVETCRQIINMPAVILGIRCFQAFLTIFWSKTWTWRPIVNIPLVFLAAFFPFFTVFFYPFFGICSNQNCVYPCLEAVLCVKIRGLDRNQRHCNRCPPSVFLRPKKKDFVKKR